MRPYLKLMRVKNFLRLQENNSYAFSPYVQCSIVAYNYVQLESHFVHCMCFKMDISHILCTKPFAQRGLCILYTKRPQYLVDNTVKPISE